MKRPTTNSLGKPIAKTAEGLRNFWKWFGDSKVVDERGRPLVVYHGTRGNFSSFRPKRLDRPFFLSTSHKFSHRYVEDYVPGDEEILIHPVYVGAVNPFDFRDHLLIDLAHSQLQDWGLSDRKGLLTDGFNLKDVTDGSWSTLEGPVMQSYIVENHDGFWLRESGVLNLAVFSPTQIKSINNRGTYDPKDPVMTNPRRQKHKKKNPPAQVRYIYTEDDDAIDSEDVDWEDYDYIHRAGIHITRDRFPYLAAVVGRKVVGMLWTAFDGETYSFDVAVLPEYRGKRVGPTLLAEGLNEYVNTYSDMGAKMELFVVNKGVENWLKKHDLKVLEEVEGGSIMTNPRRSIPRKVTPGYRLFLMPSGELKEALRRPRGAAEIKIWGEDIYFDDLFIGTEDNRVIKATRITRKAPVRPAGHFLALRSPDNHVEVFYKQAQAKGRIIRHYEYAGDFPFPNARSRGDYSKGPKVTIPKVMANNEIKAKRADGWTQV